MTNWDIAKASFTPDHYYTNWDSRYLYCTAQRCTDPIPGQAGLPQPPAVLTPPPPPPAPTAEQFANAIRLR